MQHAKISSVVTYHRLLRELAANVYIEFQPSFVKGRTRIEMIEFI